MKVLHVTNAWPTEKLPVFGIFIKEQVESLAACGVDSEVFFINGREKGLLEYLRCIPALRRASGVVDVVHCHHVYSALVCILAGIRRPAVVSFMGDGAHQFKEWFPRRLSNALLRLISRRMVRRIYKTVIPADLKGDSGNVYLPNGVNLGFFVPIDRQDAKRQLGWDTGKRFLLFVSFFDRNRPGKRYPLFADVLSRLRHDYGHDDLVEFCMVSEPRERVPLIFNACDAHLMVSEFEGSPNSVKEALACNTPVVATNVGNMVDLLEGVEGCFISDDSDAGRLANLVDRVLRSRRPDTRSSLGPKRLTDSAVAERLARLYEEAILAHDA